MILRDYECETCGKREERWDDPPAVIPCTAPACSGSMSRALGGRPGGHAAASSAPAKRSDA